MRSFTGQVVAPRLKQAWREVVQLNSNLHTVFVDSSVGNGTFQQVVLKTLELGGTWVEESGDVNVLTLEQLSVPQYRPNQPQHQFRIQHKSDSSIVCRLDINHALMDGQTLELLVEHLEAAYLRNASDVIAPDYRHLITYLQGHDTASDIRYWTDYLAGSSPCYFPSLAVDSKAEHSSLSKKFQGWDSLHFQIMERTKLQQYCQTHGMTVSNLVQLAWALVLRAYTSQDAVCFGYLVSGRDLPLDDIQTAMVPYINMLVQRFDFANAPAIEDMLQIVQQEFSESSTHSICSLADTLRSQNVLGTHLFNTTISYQRHREDKTHREGVSFRRIMTFDPSEDCMTMEVDDHVIWLDPYLI